MKRVLWGVSAEEIIGEAIYWLSFGQNRNRHPTANQLFHNDFQLLYLQH